MILPPTPFHPSVRHCLFLSLILSSPFSGGYQNQRVLFNSSKPWILHSISFHFSHFLPLPYVSSIILLRSFAQSSVNLQSFGLVHLFSRVCCPPDKATSYILDVFEKKIYIYIYCFVTFWKPQYWFQKAERVQVQAYL